VTAATAEAKRQKGGVGGLGKGSNPLDSFFPFDPYLLRRSYPLIGKWYLSWEGSAERFLEGTGGGDSDEEADLLDGKETESESDIDDDDVDEDDASSSSSSDSDSDTDSDDSRMPSSYTSVGEVEVINIASTAANGNNNNSNMLQKFENERRSRAGSIANSGGGSW